MNKVGDIVRDLYRDLRDRRLLPVVIALAVAIVAVPFLLGGGGSEAVSPTAPEAASNGAPLDGADPLSPVVLADEPGLRNFRERLSRFHSRNPFEQQLTGENTAQGGDGNLEQVDGSSSSDSVTSSSSSSGTTTSTSSSTSSSTSTSTPPSAGGGSTPTDKGNSGNPGKGGGKHGGRGEDHIVRTTIDVRVGRAGKTKVLKGVESLQFLPGDKRPVVQFVEGYEDGKHAAFVVSRAVTSTAGDGKCDPGRNNCQFLLMEQGDLRTFVYGDKQETYRLELLAIHRTTVPLR